MPDTHRTDELPFSGPHHCTFCHQSFTTPGVSSTMLVLSDDGEYVEMAPVCPECEVTHHDDIAAQTRDYHRWLQQHFPPTTPES